MPVVAESRRALFVAAVDAALGRLPSAIVDHSSLTGLRITFQIKRRGVVAIIHPEFRCDDGDDEAGWDACGPVGRRS